MCVGGRRWAAADRAEPAHLPWPGHVSGCPRCPARASCCAARLWELEAMCAAGLPRVCPPRARAPGAQASMPAVGCVTRSSSCRRPWQLPRVGRWLLPGGLEACQALLAAPIVAIETFTRKRGRAGGRGAMRSGEVVEELLAVTSAIAAAQTARDAVNELRTVPAALCSWPVCRAGAESLPCWDC